MKNKFLLLIVLLLQLFIYSCSDKEDDDDFLVMGTNNIFPPFAYMSENDLLIGFDIELAKEIAKDMNKQLKIEIMDFDELIPAIQSEKIDMAVCAITITENRKRDVNFSISYFQSHQTMLIKSEDSHLFISDQENKYDGINKRLAAERGSTGAIAANEMSGSIPVVEISSLELLLMELFSSNVDAIILDYQTAKAYASKYNNLRILPMKFETEYYAVAVKKNNNELLEAVNNTISRLINSGDYIDMVELHINNYASN